MIRTRRMAAVAAALAFMLVTPGAIPAWAAEPSPSPGGSGQPALTQAEAVALVRASDPRFTGLPDYEVLRRKTASEFSLFPILSAHYRVLPTPTAELGQSAFVGYRQPGSWLIEVTLVRDCVEPTSDIVPLADPCGWRHSWYYRVQSDGTVKLMFDGGDPDDG